MPGAASDKVLMPELVAAMFQLAAAIWSVVGWFMTRVEDTCTSPVPVSVGFLVVLACSTTTLILPITGMALGFPVGLLIAWRGRGQ